MKKLYILSGFCFWAAGAVGQTEATGNVFKNGNPAEKTAYCVSVGTFAGNSFPGYVDGPSYLAEFNGPNDMAIDTAGNIYIADANNYCIRKITTFGEVSALAGSTQGYINDQGKAAQFADPAGIAVDISGNVYVADALNNCIRKITPSGLVSTIAGTGSDHTASGFTDGQDTLARFDFPVDVELDAAGNIYVADFNNNSIRKITPSGFVSTLAGNGHSGSADGQGAAARFYNPISVAVDAVGSIYVADVGNNTIRKITPSGFVSTLAGKSDNLGYLDGQGSLAKFNEPVGVTVDAVGNVYVADMANERIRMISPMGLVSTLVGNDTAGYRNGNCTSAEFNYPVSLAFDTIGNLYVADLDNNLIRIIYLNGRSAGTAPLQAQPTLQVYPNPAAGEVSLAFKDYTGPLEVRLLNPLGQTLRESPLDATDTIPVRLQVSNLPRGMYLLEAHTPQGTLTSRLVLE